ncbi:nuclear transport factor 2 family protein [Mucilaginibacter galii]|uniref:SnoaL-like domain-containing protein n=1 Tax=Mucilaginibacter galii TaxID=2005073 RepID=A0A917JDE9_9SPHI|nr:nuclear transport factor 2 family protein [Mucilaginibacter galii]GGI52487.1 hypothetical protein GCM10011425_36990 [Mucilaginibacter galii]
MKKIYFFIWVALLLHACQNRPAHLSPPTLKGDAHYAYAIKQSDGWITNPDHQNVMVAMNALKAYETGDTALLRKCVADSLTVYYDGGFYKGGRHEFMFAIKEALKALKNLRIEVKDCKSVISKDHEHERVTTWYTQYWINQQGQPDSADMVDDARFKDGKIVVCYDYMRRYKTPPRPAPKGRE